MPFVNREKELASLEEWWRRPGARIGLVWGRRRIGKTALLQRFAQQRRVVYHTGAGRAATDELRLLSAAAAPVLADGVRDLPSRPFVDWDDALETLVSAARDEPLLLVLDEFPELLAVSPELEGVIRAVWDRLRTRTQLRVLLSGSALRTMESIQEERAPLYGRIDLALLLAPFRPHEAALMLPGLAPAEQATVWGIVGGVPQYLEWWDEQASLRRNLEQLVCTPGGPLLAAGELTLAADVDAGDLARPILYAIAAGRTKHNEIASAVRADPTRVLERLTRIGLVERMVPVTEDPRRTRRRLYRIADNFLSFWLGVVDRYRAEIERGLGRSILDVLVRDLNDHLGRPWEEAVRIHLRRLAELGELGPDVVAVGRWWTAAEPPVELDAVVLAGRNRAAALVGEAKWARRVDGQQARRVLERKAAALPRVRNDIRYAVGAREEVLNADDVLAITAADVVGQ
ncbi:MAG: ATP-binding protein [Gaiellaceae bacterium]